MFQAHKMVPILLEFSALQIRLMTEKVTSDFVLTAA
jgi:hypothetical protein